MVNDFNNIDLINRVYNKYINNRIENATAYSLGNYAKKKLADETAKSIDDILQKARARSNPFNIIEEGQLKYGGPTAQSAPRQLPIVGQNFTLGNSGPMKTGKSVPALNRVVQSGLQKTIPISGNNIKMIGTSGKPIGNIPNVQTADEVKKLFENIVSMEKKMAKEGIKNIKQLPSTYVRPDSLRNIATTANKANTVKGLALGLALENLIAGNPFVSDEEMARRLQNTTGMKTARYIYNLFNNNKGDSQTGNTTDTDTNDTNSKAPFTIVDENTFAGGSNLPPIETLIRQASQGQSDMGAYDDLRGMDVAQLQDVASQTNQQPNQQSIDINSLLQAYKAQQQGLQQPYIDALQNYLDNYGEYTKGSRRAQQFYTALAGLSGNAGYKDLAKQYDPAQLELNRINLVKALQEAKAGNVNSINEIIGNAAIAQTMGLSPEAALANKNLLNAFTAQQRAQYGLQGKMYGADKSYNARIYEANLDNATKEAIAQGRMDLALKLQQMKGRTSTTNALIGSAGFATPEDVQAMLEYYYGAGASPARGLTQQGTVQQNKKPSYIH